MAFLGRDWSPGRARGPLELLFGNSVSQPAHRAVVVREMEAGVLEAEAGIRGLRSRKRIGIWGVLV